MPNHKTEAIEGSTTILDCSYDSYPKPTKVYWKKDDNIIELSDSSRKKYNGSSVEIPVLVIFDTTEGDAGKYICFVKNHIGTGYSQTLQLLIIGMCIDIQSEITSNNESDNSPRNCLLVVS